MQCVKRLVDSYISYTYFRDKIELTNAESAVTMTCMENPAYNLYYVTIDLSQRVHSIVLPHKHY